MQCYHAIRRSAHSCLWRCNTWRGGSVLQGPGSYTARFMECLLLPKTPPPNPRLRGTHGKRIARRRRSAIEASGAVSPRCLNGLHKAGSRAPSMASAVAKEPERNGPSDGELPGPTSSYLRRLQTAPRPPSPPSRLLSKASFSTTHPLQRPPWPASEPIRAIGCCRQLSA